MASPGQVICNDKRQRSSATEFIINVSSQYSLPLLIILDEVRGCVIGFACLSEVSSSAVDQIRRLLMLCSKGIADYYTLTRNVEYLFCYMLRLHWLRVYRSESNSRPPCWRTEPSTVTHHGTWGRSPLLLMSLIDERCVLPKPIGWLCLQLDWPQSVAELFRLSPLKSGTLYRNTSSQLPRCSPSGVTW